MKFVIDSKIFTYFPGMKIVTAAAMDVPILNAEARDGIASYANATWQSAGKEVAAHGNSQSHPNIKPWGDRMRDVGAPRKQFPSSVEALARRAGKGGSPVSINPLVDFYNAVSMEYLVPAGGFDMDALNNGLSLRFSRKEDRFTAFDSDEEISIPAGEVSYADGSEIITRHFVWKQSRHAILAPESKNIFFVSEILGELPSNLASDVCDALKNGILKYFGINAKTAILDQQNHFVEVQN